MVFNNCKPKHLCPAIRPTGQQETNGGSEGTAEPTAGPSRPAVSEDAAQPVPLFEEGEYIRAHRDKTCPYCEVLWIGARSSKARSDSWPLCQILYLMKRNDDLRGQRTRYPLLESSLRAAGIARTKFAIIKCIRNVLRDRYVPNGPYSEHWKIYRANSGEVPQGATITKGKRSARVAGLPSPSQSGHHTKRIQAGTGIETETTVTETNTTPEVSHEHRDPCGEPETSAANVDKVTELTEDGSETRGTANVANGGVSVSDPGRKRQSSSQNRGNIETTNPELVGMWEDMFGVQLDGAMRTTERPRLPKLKHLSEPERLWIRAKLEQAWLQCVSYDVEQQWLNANAVLYAAIRSVAASRPCKEAREAQKTWLDNKKKDEAKLRRLIGRISSVHSMPKGDRTPREKKLVKNITKLKNTHYPDMDWGGLLNHFKVKLSQLKEKISVRVAEHKRKVNRNAAGQYGKSVAGSAGLAPDVVSATAYWSGLAQPGPKKFKASSPIFQTWKDDVAKNLNTEPVLLYPIIKECIRKPSPWKAPGPDGIYNYYWQQEFVAQWIQTLVKRTLDIGRFPTALMCGRTVLLFKSGDKSMPQNYRPITCLNGCFKITNAVLTKVILQRVQDTCALPREQMALKPKVWSCMEAQLRDQALQSEIGDDCKTAWIDFSKAYDSLDHDALRFVIQTIALPAGMEEYLLKSLDSWRTQLVLSDAGKVVSGKPYPIKRGVLQGDSLSPALFVLTTSPIVAHLQRTCPTGRIQLYMDDIKLYGKTESDLCMLIKETQRVANKLGLNINLKKCALFGKSIKQSIAGFDPLGDRTYKYLGIPQRDVADIKQAYDELKAKTVQTIGETMACDYLTTRQVINRLNSKIPPVVRFVTQSALCSAPMTRGLYNKITELDNVSRAELRKVLIYKATNVSRFYLATKEGGFGYASLQQVFVEAVVSRAIYCLRAPSLCDIREFILSKFDPVKVARIALARSKIDMDIERMDMASATRTIRQHYQAKWKTLFQQSKLYQKWVQHKIDIPNSSRWLQRGEISPRNCRIAVAVQDNTLLCRGFVGSKDPNKQCRLCNAGIETASHIVTECSTHRVHMYIERHDSVARNIYAVLAKNCGFWIPHYSQKIPTVKITKSYELYWNYKFPCTQALEACRPDIVLIDRAKKRILVVEVAVSYVTRLEQMTQRKLYKYGVNGEYQADGETRGWNICRELVQKYNMRIDLCIVVIGACGEILPCMVKEIEKISKVSGRQLLERCQRSAVLGTVRTVRRHLAN
uniref:Reverse transcriptase domain-containing protein n=1 Tax=Bursaphelenchus xylophilus TaxID=6326 RepID=A0A1I7S6I1_BURXY